MSTRFKWLLLLNTVAFFIFGFVSSVAALTIAEVGSLDPLIYFTAENLTGAAEEAAWINSVLGASYTYQEIEANKIENLNHESFFQKVTDGVDNQWAFELPYENGYFLFKTGTGTYKTWLFENIDSTFYGTFAIGNEYPLGGDTTINFDIKDIESISHITKTPIAPIPEPSTLLLLGAGLAGLGFYSLKRGKK